MPFALTRGDAAAIASPFIFASLMFGLAYFSFDGEEKAKKRKQAEERKKTPTREVTMKDLMTGSVLDAYMHGSGKLEEFESQPEERGHCDYSLLKPNQLVKHRCKLPAGHEEPHYCAAHQHEI